MLLIQHNFPLAEFLQAQYLPEHQHTVVFALQSIHPVSERKRRQSFIYSRRKYSQKVGGFKLTTKIKELKYNGRLVNGNFSSQKVTFCLLWIIRFKEPSVDFGSLYYQAQHLVSPRSFESHGTLLSSLDLSVDLTKVMEGFGHQIHFC